VKVFAAELRTLKARIDRLQAIDDAAKANLHTLEAEIARQRDRQR
jgi:hypothetical protein